MNKKIILSILIIFSLLLITGCNSKIKKNKDNSKEVINSVIAIIEEKEYTVNLEENETVKKFIDMLPLEINMEELNENEKYTYLNESLPVNSYNPKKINKGDVMLYGDNCLVIFYKSFETAYNYTKIGHIDNLPDLGNKSIYVNFKK